MFYQLVCDVRFGRWLPNVYNGRGKNVVLSVSIECRFSALSRSRVIHRSTKRPTRADGTSCHQPVFQPSSPCFTRSMRNGECRWNGPGHAIRRSGFSASFFERVTNWHRAYRKKSFRPKRHLADILLRFTRVGATSLADHTQPPSSRGTLGTLTFSQLLKSSRRCVDADRVQSTITGIRFDRNLRRNLENDMFFRAGCIVA